MGKCAPAHAAAAVCAADQGILADPFLALYRFASRMPTELPISLLPPAWHAPLLIRASAACHVGAGLAIAHDPGLWPWALGAIGANQVALTAAGLWPRCNWLGENIRELPAAAAARGEVALTFDDGPDAQTTPKVLAILETFDARATFFCIGERARRQRALCREIVQRGHSVQNHSDSHRHGFALSGLSGFVREIGNAQASLADITGHAPRFFRAPAGLRNPLLGAALERLDLRLVSWTRRGFDTVQGRAERVLARLAHRLAAGDLLLLHDGNAARSSSSGRPVVLDVLPLLLQRLAQARLRCVTLPEALRPERAR
jgi:peptidoglycan/xylan/chitin deacetylase (PgdA/CDA1 family)